MTSMMRGVILAGGSGTRLGHLTRTINKHVLPVDDKPMIFYPLSVLMRNGITDITIVSTPRGVGQIAELVGSGSSFDAKCQISYRVQDRAGGIVQALRCAEPMTLDDRPVAVILGDNIFTHVPVLRPERKARCYIYHTTPERLKSLGVAQFGPVPSGAAAGATGKVLRVIEKPEFPPSSYAVVGLYVFGGGVWNASQSIRPSERGETEIASLLNMYAEAGMLSHARVHGFWGDAGTPDGIYECATSLRNQPV